METHDLAFAKRFEDQVAGGLKLQSLRRPDLPIAPGDQIRLLSEDGAVLAGATCTVTMPVLLELERGEITRLRCGFVPILHLDNFAISDGFLDAADMALFLISRIGEGVHRRKLIEWAIDPVDAALAA